MTLRIGALARTLTFALLEKYSAAFRFNVAQRFRVTQRTSLKPAFQQFIRVRLELFKLSEVEPFYALGIISALGR
jgi:hypothetical protein